jgi:hypothetical protein
MRDTDWPVDLPGFQGSAALGTFNKSLAFVVAENGSFRLSGTIIEEDWVNDPDPDRQEVGIFDEDIPMDGVQFGVNEKIFNVTFDTNDPDRQVKVTVEYTVYQ